MSATQAARRRINDWLGLIRFSHTIFALPFAALATVMAFAAPLPSGSYPAIRLRDLVGILLCMILARSAAMAFNRLADAKIDAKNPRTSQRHLPAGILSKAEVWGFTIACSAGFIASTALFLPNYIPLAASVPLLLFLLGYSLAKRFTAAAHLWLGIALSLAPLCAWVAIRGVQSVMTPSDLIAPLVLAAAVAAWVTGFDIIYACQDAEYDAKQGLHSVPARLGVAGALRMAAVFHVAMLILLALLPLVAAASGIGWVFWGSLVFIAALVVRQHTLVQPNDLNRVNQAFFDTNAVISVALLVVGSVDCLIL